MLSVAGADPSGASGVHRDVATFEALGYAGTAAITAITAQNTSRFVSAEPVPARMVSEQIGAVFEDFDVRAVKVGMVRGGEAIAAVRKALRRWIYGRRGAPGGRGRIPVVVDPVARSTTGGALLDRASLGAYRASIVPLATAITPNLHELGVLAGRRIPAGAGAAAVGRAARAVVGMGAGGVVATGVRMGRLVGDIVLDGAAGEPVEVTGGRVPVRGGMRGSGCTHSAALAASLASGMGLAEAARRAAGIAYAAIAGGEARGAGTRVAAAVGARGAARGAPAPPAARILENAASMFAAIPRIGAHMPECQSNIAYAHGAPPASPAEVWGLDGRIVSTMSGGAIVPGRAALGASRHVAAALVEASGRFPGIRAAANVRYDPGDVDAARRIGMAVSSYDRAAEPGDVRGAEGASVRWGVREALRGARRPRDVVYHTGAPGKEPMAVVFGKSPRDVVSKVSRIVREARRAGAAPLRLNKNGGGRGA